MAQIQTRHLRERTPFKLQITQIQYNLGIVDWRWIRRSGQLKLDASWRIIGVFLPRVAFDDNVIQSEESMQSILAIFWGECSELNIVKII